MAEADNNYSNHCWIAGMCKAQKDLFTEAEWVSYTLKKTAVLASVYIL